MSNKFIKKYSTATFVALVFISLLVFGYKKTEALNKPNVSSSKSSMLVGETATITYSSSDGTSCSTNFNSSSATSGTYSFTPSAAGTYTFSVTCQKTWATTTSCFGGFYGNPDSLHPSGGTVTYTNPDGSAGSMTGIWNDDAIYIEYRNGTVSATGAGINAGNCL